MKTRAGQGSEDERRAGQGRAVKTREGQGSEEERRAGHNIYNIIPLFLVGAKST